MADVKKQFIISTLDIITQNVTEIVKSSGGNYKSSDEYIQHLLGVNSAQLANIVLYIANFIPERLYLSRFEDVMKYFQFTVVRELILFLIREDVNSKYFADCLLNFKDEIISNVLTNVYQNN